MPRSLVDWLALLFDDFAGFDGMHTRCTTARVTSKAQERKNARKQEYRNAKTVKQTSVATSYTRYLEGLRYKGNKGVQIYVAVPHLLENVLKHFL